MRKSLMLPLISLLLFFGFGNAAIDNVGKPDTLTAANAKTTISGDGYGTVGFQITGTWSGTITFEGTVNNSTWVSINAYSRATGTGATTTTANGVFVTSSAGIRYVRARVSSYTSGSIIIQGLASMEQSVTDGGGGSGGGGAGDASASNQTSGAQKTQIVDGSGNVISSTSNNLNVQCANCSGSGASAADGASFTAGSSVFAPSGGIYQADQTANPLTTGKQGLPQMTRFRGLHSNLRDSTGAVIGNAANPMRMDPTGTTTQPVSLASVPSHAVTNAGTFAVQAAQSGTWNVTNISGTVSLPTGAATAAKQPALGTAGSSSTDVISVQGIASGTALPISAASLPLPSTAATSTKQSDGTQKTQIVDGSGNVIASTSNNLNVQCANCSGSGVSATDGASFTASTSSFALGGGVYQVTQTANPVTTGQQGATQMTRFRAIHVNLRDSTGAVLGNSTTPLQVSLANTGSNATAVKVDNSAVTQPVSGTVSAAQSGTWNVTNISGTVSLPTGAATAAKQPALGTAGSPSTDVITVQGSGSGTALPVSLASVPSHAVTNAGTFAVQATVAAGATTIAKAEDVASADADVGVPSMAIRKATPANTSSADGDYEALQMSAGRLWVDGSGVTQTVAGVAAHDAAISGNPVRGAARARTSDYTAVANDDVADILATIEGKLITQPYGIRASTWKYAAAAGGLVTTSGVTIKTAAGAGIRNCIDAIQMMNSHQTTSTEIEVRDGAAGTVLWRGWAQAAGGGAAPMIQTPICGTANTLLEVAEVTTTGTAGVLFNAQGHITQE